MKKTLKMLSMLLAAGMVVSASSCAMASREEVVPEAPVPVVQAVSPAEVPAKVQRMETPVIVTPAPAPVETETPVEPVPIPEVPAERQRVPEPEAAPVPAAPVHVHDWQNVTQTVHHEAVTEEVKVVDQPATEGHFEGGTYPVVVCRCGAEFTSAAEYYAHSEVSGEGHGGFTDSIRSDQVWVEGSPEIAHYETRVLRDAWDEEMVTGAVCASCGATK